MRSCYQRCQREFLLRYACGLVPVSAGTRGGAPFGTAFHLATEEIDTGKDVDTAMAAFTDCFQSNDKVRTPDRARQLLNSYIRFKEIHDMQFAAPPEISFQVPLTDHLVHAGRYDRILSSGWPMDIKTTKYLYDGAGSSAGYLDTWVGHNSLRGYAYPIEAPMVRIVAFGVQPQKSKYNNAPLPDIDYIDIPIFQWELEAWKEETILLGEDILRKLDAHSMEVETPESNLLALFDSNCKNLWTTNTGSCYRYFTFCDYRDLCIRNVPENMARSLYNVDNWKPWQGRTTVEGEQQ